MLKIVIFETLAANLGSALTQWAIHKIFFIYSFYNITPKEFFSITVPLFVIYTIFASNNFLRKRIEI